MKQETGKTNLTNKNSLSIQISLNGHSFLYSTIKDGMVEYKYSIDSICSKTTKESISHIELSVANPLWVIIPTDIYCEESKESYLATKSNNKGVYTIFSCTYGDFTLVSSTLCGSDMDIDRLRSKTEVSLSHPLIELLKNIQKATKNTIAVFCVENYAYFVAKNDKEILFIDSFSIEEQNDVVDFLKIISERFSLKNARVMPIYVSEELQTKIEKVFKTIY